VQAVRLLLKRTYSNDRMNALSDGVYAFALTLLVLDLKAPENPGVTNPELTADLLQQIPNFMAYTIGFLIVAFFWIIHHRILQSVTKCDERALMFNLLHLLFISLTPYVASLIGHYEGDRIASIVFSANLGLASLSLNMLGFYVRGKKEWRTAETEGTWATVPWWTVPWWTVYAGPVLALVSILLSLIRPDVAILIWLLLPMKELVAWKWEA
jgi:uncharacterized membrane protein